MSASNGLSKQKAGVMDASDKRRAQRFPMALSVAVKVDEAGGEKAVKTKDISSSGVFLEFAAPIDIGSSLEFVLTLPAEITKGQAVRVKCRGKVVRIEKQHGDGTVIGAAATIERYEFLRE
jgi:hypothetical protein